ncbi:MAG: biotin/lipoyl-binding protein [Ottowia sp.]|nr:biotin/lipoyl-binding protein [Ottowia sp.]
MKRILIANRGEIARRVIATARRMGIETVAVYSDPDAHALHVQEATVAFALGGRTSAESYLRVDRLLQAARATGADAVHPGYGFLSEDASFAQAVVDAGLTWIGPPPAAIRALGSKSAAKALALAHDVPCLPGYAGDDQSEARFASEAERVGYPVMVKAVAGGGGRGMRLVTEAAQLPAALASARAEALAGFGNGDLLIERALMNPRHVEVQVFADAHGGVIHLGERDCSVQRRHQKIIEEAPSPAVDAALRARLGACAVALARAAGYVGAGTVEFLLEEGCASGAGAGAERGGEAQPTPGRPKAAAAPMGGSAAGAAAERGGEVQPTPGRPKEAAAPLGGSAAGAAAKRGGLFFLMEMNTRLQVEHPVTEALTGLDLVEWQIRVARGEPLPLTQDQVQLQGHAIEVRLCAEDERFTPHAGRVLRWSAPPAASFERAPLRFDHAMHTGSEVTPYYDAMLGKLIAHGRTRAAAMDRLMAALGQLQVLGLPTNRAFLIECLGDAHFRAGNALISYLATDGDRLRESLWNKEQKSVDQIAPALAFGQDISALPCRFAVPIRLQHRDRVLNRSARAQADGTLQMAAAEGAVQHIQIKPLPDGGMQLTTDDGTTRPLHAVRVPGADGGARWHAQCGAVDWWVQDTSFAPAAGDGTAKAATELRAPFNGKVVRVAVQPGQLLAGGVTALVIESMKLEHSLSARADATVAEVLVAEGQQVAPGQVLLRFAVQAPK